MSTVINKAGEDWLLTKKWLNDKIDNCHTMMENNLETEAYHFACGQIALARDLMEHVEPTTPPVTVEDNYEISDPNKGPY